MLQELTWSASLRIVLHSPVTCCKLNKCKLGVRLVTNWHISRAVERCAGLRCVHALPRSLQPRRSCPVANFFNSIIYLHIQVSSSMSSWNLYHTGFAPIMSWCTVRSRVWRLINLFRVRMTYLQTCLETIYQFRPYGWGWKLLLSLAMKVAFVC
jgi:hypothetical protein